MEKTPIQNIKASAYQIPTDLPESDGTLEWNSTTLVLVQVEAGGKTGIGYTYSHSSTAQFINEKFSKLLMEKNAFDVRASWLSMQHAVRNFGFPGICASAISAVDAALWDLKARLLNLPLVNLLDRVHERVPIYGSGGFTSYSNQQLEEQFLGWKQQGIKSFKMKIGRHPEKDLARIKYARDVIGYDNQLFVDANGAFTIKEALAFAEKMQEYQVTWFEEPVSSDNLAGLHFLREHTQHSLEIAAGEYGYTLYYFQNMLQAGAVDVLQADCTRCGGITGFIEVGSLCHSQFIDLSGHTAPQLHLHACSAIIPLRHLEYFHDHVRIENMLFEGVIQPKEGYLKPDLSRPGLGLEFKEQDAKKFSMSS